VGVLVGAMISNISKYTEVRRAQDLSKLALHRQNNLSLAVTQDRMSKFPLAVIREVAALFESAAVFVWAYDQTSTMLFRHGVDPLKKAKLDDITFCPLWGIVGEAIFDAKSVLVQLVSDYRKRKSEVFDMQIDCPIATAKARSILCSPIFRPGVESKRSNICGAISVIWDNSKSRDPKRRICQGEVRALEQICVHISGLVNRSQEEADQLKLDEATIADILKETEDEEDLKVLTSEEAMCSLAQLLTIKHQIHSNRDAVAAHMKMALKISKEWKQKDFLEWFEKTEKTHYSKFMDLP